MDAAPAKNGAAPAEAPAPNVEYVTVPVEKRVIYKWRADDGTMRYTDEENTPKDKRAKAERIVH